MTAETHVVEARTHGRYLVRPPQGEPRGILLGFHGYMQNAADCMADLESIPELGAWALVAVDALHAFYAKSSGSGKVVRGWMTRDLREESIADNVAYVRGILETVRARFGWRLPVAVLGFSQGASMAWRSALLSGHEMAAAIALGGDMPPELGALPDGEPFPRRALLARGDADDWYTEERLEGDRALVAARGVEVEVLCFRGGHEWSEPFRSAVAALLAQLGGEPSLGRR